MGSHHSSLSMGGVEDDVADVDLAAVAEAEKHHGHVPTATKTMRVIYFRGHPEVPNSALITRVCKQVSVFCGYQFTALPRWASCATQPTGYCA